MVTEQKATRMRKVIASNMSMSWQTSPKCDYEMRVNAEPMMAFRKSYNEKTGVKVSFLDLVIKAVALALKEYPYINSAYNSETHTHLLNNEINIGFAVTVGDGLMVANARNADKLNLTALSEETKRLIDAVKNGRPSLDDVTGSSITINNMGAYKRLIHHNAIINQPELAILSMYNITDEPVVRDGAVVIQKTMTLMLTADHRVIDGKMACDFLDLVVSLLETPEKLDV